MHDWQVVRNLSGVTSPFGFSPDGRLLATSDEEPGEGPISVFDTATGRRVRHLVGHWHTLSAICFSPDGSTLAASSFDASTKIWSMHRWRELRPMNQERAITDMAYAADGSWLASVSSDGPILIRRGKLDVRLPSLGAKCIAAIPGCETIVAGDSHGTLHEWNVLDLFRNPPKFAKASPPTASVRDRSLKWRLAFVRDGNIRLANGDGSGQHLIIRNGTDPCWSPDKKKLAFIRGGNIWVASSDGSRQRVLTVGRERKGANRLLTYGSGSIAWNPVDPFLLYSRYEEFPARGPKSVVNGGEMEALCSVPLGVKPKASDILMDIQYTIDGYRFSAYENPSFDKTGTHLAFGVNGDLWVADRGEYISYSGAKGFWAWAWNLSRASAPADYDEGNLGADREVHGVTHVSWAPNGQSLAYGIQRLGGSGFWEVHLVTFEPKTRERRATKTSHPAAIPHFRRTASRFVTWDQGKTTVRCAVFAF